MIMVEWKLTFLHQEPWWTRHDALVHGGASNHGSWCKYVVNSYNIPGKIQPQWLQVIPGNLEIRIIQPQIRLLSQERPVQYSCQSPDADSGSISAI